MSKKRFRKIYVEITNVCNLNCSFCSDSKRNKQFISVTNFETILQKIHSYTNNIYLHIKGEPLLHPQLNAILDLCAYFGLKTVLVTNGTLLSKTGEMLLSKPTIKQVNVSLHCFTELPKTISKEDYYKALIDFIKLSSKKSEIDISLRLWNQNNMRSEVSLSNQNLFEMLEAEYNLDFHIVETIKTGVGLKIAERLWLNSDYEFQWPNMSSPLLSDTGTCLGLRDQIAILSNGTIVPCCIDAEGIIDLGNIFENDFQDVIDSERAKTIIKGFQNSRKVEALCQRCGFFS